MTEPTYRYRALVPIAVDGVRAYNAGDWVPDENVELHDYEVDVLVERVEIPAAEDESEADPAQSPAPAVIPPTPPAEATPPAEKSPVKKPRPTPSA